MKKLSLIIVLLFLPNPIFAIEASLWKLDKKYGSYWELDKKYRSYDYPGYWDKKGYSLNYPTVQLNIIDSISGQPLKSPPNDINVYIRWPARIGGESNYWWDCNKGKDDLYFRNPPHGQVNFESPWYIIPTMGKRPMCIKVYETGPESWEVIELVNLHKGNNRLAIKIEKPVPVSKPLQSEPSKIPKEPSYLSNSSRKLDGWWVFKFGMTKEQAKEIMEANKDKVLKYDIAKENIGMNIQMYDTEWYARVEFKGDRLNVIRLFLARMHENVKTYADFMRIRNYYLKRIVDKYGPWNFEDVKNHEDKDCVYHIGKNCWEFENAAIRINDVWGEKQKGSKIFHNLEKYNLSIIYEMKKEGKIGF